MLSFILWYNLSPGKIKMKKMKEEEEEEKEEKEGALFRLWKSVLLSQYGKRSVVHLQNKDTN